MEIAGVLFFIATVVLTFVTASVARKRGRSGIGWFLLACVISPYISLIVLACIGETDEKKRDRIYEEELIRKSIRQSDSYSRNEETSIAKTSQPKDGKTINDLYKR